MMWLTKVRLIMVFTGGNNNTTGKNPVYQSMLPGNASGPVARQIILQRFRFSFAVEKVPQYGRNKAVDFGKDLFVFLCPLI